MNVISGKAIPVSTLKCERPNMPKAMPTRRALILSFFQTLCYLPIWVFTHLNGYKQ